MEICWYCLKSESLTSLEAFECFFNFFWFCLILSVRENMKNSIFEMPIITQTLNINNLRTTSAKSINLHTIRKLVELSFKIIVKKTMFFISFERYCCPNAGRCCNVSSGAQGTQKG